MILHNNKLCPRGFVAWVFFGIIITSRSKLSARTLNHERIHCRQQLEMLYLPFYLWYGLEWLVKLLRYRNFEAAYRNISFEREAYHNDADLQYLKHRSFLAFLKYVRQ